VVKVKHKESLDIEFRYPDLKGEYYEPHSQICYLFWSSDEPELESVEYIIASLNHVELHFRIQQLEGITKSRKFDVVASKVFKWDEEVYNALY
jgi:hypothetical protein